MCKVVRKGICGKKSALADYSKRLGTMIQKAAKILRNQRLNLSNSTVGSCKKHIARCIVEGERRKNDESDRDWKIYCQMS